MDGNIYKWLVPGLCLAVVAAILWNWERDHSTDSGGPRNRALLIGVSDYDQLTPDRDLLGPANDVRMLRDLLTERGFEEENILVLADGVKDARPPTRNNILAAWRELIATARDDDSLVLYFAGHGSQQPATDDEETDGLEEIILPQDVGQWDGAAGRVKNAITDNEIGRFLDSIRALGTNVWAIFDACHSGTLTRTLGAEGERSRFLDPMAYLNVPAQPVETAPMLPTPAERDWLASDPGRGELIAFFAAGDAQTTPELRLPRAHPERQYHGLFSFTLAKALSISTPASFRELANQMLLDYAASNRRFPNPSFTGNLDSPVFFTDAAGRQPGWAVTSTASGEYRVAAGALNGLTQGAQLELRSTAGDTRATLEIQELGLRQSVASIEVAPGVTLPARGRAFPVSQVVDFSLSLCRPKEAVPVLNAVVDSSERFRWVEDGDCDVTPLIDEQSIMLADTTTQVLADTSVEKQIPGVARGDRAELKAVLERVAKTRALLAALSETRGSVSGLDVRARATRDTAVELKLTTDQTTTLVSGDRLELALTNASERAVDLTVLFIDSMYNVATFWPAAGQSNRIAPGTTKVRRGTIDTAMTIGVERLVVIATRAERDTVPMDFSFLAQSTVSDQRRNQAPLANLLYQAGFVSSNTRGRTVTEADAAQVILLSWQTR